jgi:hypothetical protein
MIDTFARMKESEHVIRSSLSQRFRLPLLEGCAESLAMFWSTLKTCLLPISSTSHRLIGHYNSE